MWPNPQFFNDIFCFDSVDSDFTLLPALSFRNHIRYFLDLTFLARNKTVLVDDFTDTKFFVIPKMNCKVTFPSSVNVASILPLIMTQTMQGGNSNYISMRIFVDIFLIFQSSEISVNTSNVSIDDIVSTWRTVTRIIKEI